MYTIDRCFAGPVQLDISEGNFSRSSSGGGSGSEWDGGGKAQRSGSGSYLSAMSASMLRSRSQSLLPITNAPLVKSPGSSFRGERRSARRSTCFKPMLALLALSVLFGGAYLWTRPTGTLPSSAAAAGGAQPGAQAGDVLGFGGDTAQRWRQAGGSVEDGHLDAYHEQQLAMADDRLGHEEHQAESLQEEQRVRQEAEAAAAAAAEAAAARRQARQREAEAAAAAAAAAAAEAARQQAQRDAEAAALAAAQQHAQQQQQQYEHHQEQQHYEGGTDHKQVAAQQHADAQAQAQLHALHEAQLHALHEQHQQAAALHEHAQQLQHAQHEAHAGLDVPPPRLPPSLYESGLSAVDIHGNVVHLSDLRGRAALFVNVASQCGYTQSNYEGLQQIYERYSLYGLEILAFPCNQFGNQEPGSNEEIQQFVESHFQVRFTMMSKVDVNGEQAHPIFSFLKQNAPPLPGHPANEDIAWNFQKFLVDKWGHPVKRYASDLIQYELETDVYNELIKVYGNEQHLEGGHAGAEEGAGGAAAAR